MDRYQLLPFDDRYRDTPYEWMEHSYIRFMENRDWNEIRDSYLIARYEEDKKARVESDLQESLPDLKRSGYTEEDISEIMDVLKESAR